VDGERRQILGQAGGGTRILGRELANEGPQIVFGLGRRGGLVERRPVGSPDALVERPRT